MSCQKIVKKSNFILRRVEDDRRRREEDVGRRREDDYDERITMGGRMEQGSKVSPLQV